MLTSTTKQSQVLTSEILRLKKKLNDNKDKYQNKSQLIAKAKRENRRGVFSHKKSHRNDGSNLYGLKQLGRTFEENTSPRFQPSSSQANHKVPQSHNL